MKLTQEQKILFRKTALISDLIELTREHSADDSLDGRTKEGRAVKKF